MSVPVINVAEWVELMKELSSRLRATGPDGYVQVVDFGNLI